MSDSLMEETLMEEKDDLIITPFTEEPSWRVAHFLKPTFPKSKQPQNSQPNSPDVKSLSSNVNFYGWRHPLVKWNSWVEKLLPSFESSWKTTSIYEPIMGSKLGIPRCNDTIFALAQRWCPETSSFLLPWGEITITLEDVLVLGGYSVLGGSVLGSCNSEKMREIKEKLEGVRREIIQTKAKRADQRVWLETWMERGGEFEHEAFLSLWLSRFVLPSDSVNIIPKNVFQIAIRLASGEMIALAPAILARIYRDLRLLKEKIETWEADHEENLRKLNVWAPLQLLQMWVWERFPSLSPVPNVIFHGQPRSARWHKVRNLRKNHVGLKIDSARENFRWRAYCECMISCSFLAKFYPENASWVSVDSEFDGVLLSYARIIRVSYLVGLDCIELYLPHRVAMQFGFDQEIPGFVPQLRINSKDAWVNYIRSVKDVKLYVPSRLCKPGVTMRYFKWCKNAISSKGPVKNSVVSKFQCSLTTSERIQIKLENNEAVVPPGFEPKGKRRLEETQGCSPKINVIDVEDDSDDDNLIVSQFLHKQTNCGYTSGSFSPSSEIHVSSAGQNVHIHDQKNKALTKPEEQASREILVEDGTEIEDGTKIEDGNSMQSPTTIIENQIDLLGRIARLEKIVNVVKMAQISQQIEKRR